MYMVHYDPEIGHMIMNIEMCIAKHYCTCYKEKCNACVQKIDSLKESDWLL